MKNFLEKLDRKAAHWLGTLDEQLQQPIVQAITGEVFTHGVSTNGHRDPVQPIVNTGSAVQDHEYETGECDVPCPPVLRNANALSNR